MPYKTIIEPFRIKMIEPIRILSREERIKRIKAAHFNLFKLKSDDVLIDLLTDSGTSAMSQEQWAAMVTGDESYAGSRSFFAFQSEVQKITGYKHVFPTHQGRAAERILFTIIGGEGKKILNNSHFDTTRANIEYTKAEALDLVTENGLKSNFIHPFKGNIDLEKLENALKTDSHAIPLVMLTITNNSGGGQPVSMENIRKTGQLCRQYNVPFFLDACRFAENAYFIKIREEGYQDKSILEISNEMFSYADGCLMSAKKDAFVNIGGFIAVNDDSLAEQISNLEILTEGFPTYGGLSGRDLAALAQGLKEIVEEDYLHYRHATMEYLGKALTQIGIPIVLPVGGHAVYIDAQKLLPHLKALEFPAQSLAVNLYVEGGIRSVEIGSLMFGKYLNGEHVPAKNELVRLALPRRVYTQSHVDYMIEVFESVFNKKEEIRGLKIVKEPPFLRHFSAELDMI